MNDPLGVVFTIILLFILSMTSLGCFDMGAYYGAKEAKNQTTIECIKTPEKCKQRYEYLKLREKLGEN